METLTVRQREVLDIGLLLLVESNAPLTMSAIASRANCSKETLYKWFGDRDGLLTAIVQRQASKVRAAPVPPEGLDRDTLIDSLEHFALDWLRTLSGTTSVVLNRLATCDVGEGRTLGRIVLENGPLAMHRRLQPVLEAGRTAGLLFFDDEDEAFRCFFGLVVRDLQIRRLLGDDDRPLVDDAFLAADASRAVQQFVVLYGGGT